MKRTITVTKEVEITLPAFRRFSGVFYMISENYSLLVDTQKDFPEINTYDADMASPWDKKASDCTPSEFYEAFANTMQRLKNIAGIEELPLVETQTYLEQVAEECKHDCEPDHEERDHMEEMEYRSMQMGSL